MCYTATVGDGDGDSGSVWNGRGVVEQREERAWEEN